MSFETLLPNVLIAHAQEALEFPGSPIYRQLRTPFHAGVLQAHTGAVRAFITWVATCDEDELLPAA